MSNEMTTELPDILGPINELLLEIEDIANEEDELLESALYIKRNPVNTQT
jgi:hypothetical protein